MARVKGLVSRWAKVVLVLFVLSAMGFPSFAAEIAGVECADDGGQPCFPGCDHCTCCPSTRLAPSTAWTCEAVPMPLVGIVFVPHLPLHGDGEPSEIFHVPIA